MEEICADVQLSVEATPTGDYVAKVQSSSLFGLFSDVSSEEVASKYMLNNVQAAGVQPGMPWSAFPEISTEAQRVLESTYSTKAFIELHYVPETFDKLFNMDKKFARLPIFRKDGSVFVQLASKTTRYPYIAIHNAGMERLQDNRKWRTRNVQTGNKPDIARFFNMAFVSETKSDRYVCQKTGEEIRYSQVDGFFPYFSNRSDKLKEIMFYFHHKVIFLLLSCPAPTQSNSSSAGPQARRPCHGTHRRARRGHRLPPGSRHDPRLRQALRHVRQDRRPAQVQVQARAVLRQGVSDEALGRAQGWVSGVSGDVFAPLRAFSK